MSRVVGAYVCPRGVHVIEARRMRAGLEIVRNFEVPATLTTPAEAADHLANALSAAGIRRADVAVAVRGFGVVHHILGVPAASDEVLTPIVERELRRLEPQLGDALVSWCQLPDDATPQSQTPPDPSTAPATPAPQMLAAGAPRETVEEFESRLPKSGYGLLHLTALPVAFQRLQEEFDPSKGPAALVAFLADGDFLGFFLGGALRLAVEPPPHQDEAQPDATVVAEEVELGSMFVRQQFRGAHIERVTVLSTDALFEEAEPLLTERLGIPVGRLAVRELNGAGAAALGAILDARSATPVALGGTSRQRRERRGTSSLRAASIAAVLVASLVGAWTLTEAVRARRASGQLQEARRRVEQEFFVMTPLRETAERRRLIRDAVTAMQIVASDRAELQRAIAGVASASVRPVRLDSLVLDRDSDGWAAALGGRIVGEPNTRAVQTLHDYAQELRLLPTEDVSLEQLTYAESGAPEAEGAEGGGVRFRLSFVIPSARKP